MANAECSECGAAYPAARRALGYHTCLTCGDHAAREARMGWCIAPAGHKQGYTIHTSTGARDALRGLNKTTT